MTEMVRDPAAQKRAVELTSLVERAQRGLRSDVEALVEALRDAELLVPLASDLEDVPEGERIELTDSLKLTPHLLADEDMERYCALLTESELAPPLQEQLGWRTGEGSLAFVSLPARGALELALSLIDEGHARGLVLNPLHHSELMLTRAELASIHANAPIPLVGYVRDIPASADENTLEAEPESPPSAELLGAIERALSGERGVSSWELKHTFNRERDLEPHPTLVVRATGDVDREAVARALFEAIEGHVPPPGYLDLVFDVGDNE